MIINGKDLYEAWLKWTESEETKKIPFVLRHETWWGDERNCMVRDIRNIPNSPSQYEVKLFNHKFLMTGVTGGFWLIWVFIREMRRG